VVSLTIARWPLRREQLRRRSLATYTTRWDATSTLVAVHGEQALPLNELILLRSEPRTQQSTAYFYNRREAGDLCYVSYQYAEEDEVPEHKPYVERLIAAIDQLTP
jgi:hypothetical protein